METYPSLDKVNEGIDRVIQEKKAVFDILCTYFEILSYTESFSLKPYDLDDHNITVCG